MTAPSDPSVQRSDETALQWETRNRLAIERAQMVKQLEAEQAAGQDQA